MSFINDLQQVHNHYNRTRVLKQLTKLQRKCFTYAYDKDKVYGVNFIQGREIDEDCLGEPTENMFNVLDCLANRQVTGKAARDLVEASAAVDGDLIKLICNKDLRCGVTATTFNKVWPGDVPQFKVQLAKELPSSKLTYPLLAQLKYDGVRVLMIWHVNKITFKTRNGKVLHLPKLAAEIAPVLTAKGIDDCILDGEMTLADGKVEDRTTVSGMLNSARCGNPISEHKLEYNIFDWLPYADFLLAKCNIGYLERLTQLSEIHELLPSFVKLAESHKVSNAAEVDEWYSAVISQGYEGLILKPYNHKYTFKRSTDWVKLKEIKSADLTCVGIQGGTGKYEGMIGALICQGKVEGKDVTVNVGSGLTDLARSQDFGDFLYKTIEVKYNSVIQDSVTGEWSLFLPRFVTVRFDK
jgi:DNA ligase-1